MKKLFIIANWKSNKTEPEAKDWLQRFKIQDLRFKNKKVIVCSSFTLLHEMKSLITNYQLPITLGAQNISPFDGGSYTGEVSARQIKEFADYVIIGHSERKTYFNETDEMINRKIEMALKYDLIPILCVLDIGQMPNSKIIVAYEPLFAVGSGNPDTPENADNIALGIKKTIGEISVLYGGSVTSKNAKDFTQMPNIDGVLVGSASLDPLEFSKIIEVA